jgi:integrase/recombinase XerD
MTKQRDRMKQDLELHGYAIGTRSQYLMAARRFAEHFGKPPERMGQEQVRAYIEHLRKKRKCGASVLKVQMAGIRFLYAVTLGKPDVVAWMAWPRQPVKLALVLSGSEIAKLLGAMSNPMFRAVALVMYGAGLRISEACALQVTDIDAARGVLHVRHGKGNRERCAVLPKSLLVALRSYWAASRPPLPFLFPAEDATKPIAAERVRTAVATAVKASGLASAPRRTRFATPSRRTCWRWAPTFATSKCCSVTPPFVPRCATRRSAARGSRRPGARSICSAPPRERRRSGNRPQPPWSVRRLLRRDGPPWSSRTSSARMGRRVGEAMP